MLLFKNPQAVLRFLLNDSSSGPYLESLPVQWNELNNKDEKAEEKMHRMLFVFMKGNCYTTCYVRRASNKYSNNRILDKKAKGNFRRTFLTHFFKTMADAIK